MSKELTVEWEETSIYSMTLEVPDDFDPSLLFSGSMTGTDLELAVCNAGYGENEHVVTESRYLKRVTADDGETWEY